MIQGKDYKVYIDFGSGFELINNVIYDECNLIREKQTRLIIRLKVEGTFIFFGDVYDQIKSFEENDIFELPLKLEERNEDTNIFEEILLCKLDLRGKYSEDIRYCYLSVISNDIYFNFFDRPVDNIDTEYDIFELDTETVTLDIEINDLIFTVTDFGATHITDPPSYSSLWFNYQFLLTTNPDNYIDVPIYAHEQQITLNRYVDFYTARGWELLSDNGDGTSTLVRDWQDGNYKNPTSDFFYIKNYDNDPGYITNNNQKDYLDGKLSTILLNVKPFFKWAVLYIIDNEYYGNSQKYLSRGRDLREVIEFLVTKINTNVLFDSSSFEFFDKEGNEELSVLYFATIYDITGEDIQEYNRLERKKDTLNPNDENDANEISNINDELERRSPKTEIKVALSLITEFLELKFHAYWFVEEISSSYYFRLKHITDINIIDSGLDLTNYRGVNWVSINKNYTYETNKETKLTRKDNSTQADFIGQSIEFPTIIGKNEKNISYEIDTDVEGIIKQNQFIDDGYVIYNSERNEFPIEEFINDDITPFDSLVYDNSTGYLQIELTSASTAKCDSLPTTVFAGSKYTIELNTITDNPVTLIIRISTPGALYTSLPTLNNGIQSYDIYPPFDGELNFTISTTTVVDASIQFKLYFNEVIKGTGAISGLELYNVGLSTANTDEKYYSEAPSKTAIINGNTLTNINKRPDKIHGDGIKFPVSPLVKSLDFQKYLTSNVGQVVVEKQQRSMKNSLDVLTLYIKEN